MSLCVRFRVKTRSFSDLFFSLCDEVEWTVISGSSRGRKDICNRFSYDYSAREWRYRSETHAWRWMFYRSIRIASPPLSSPHPHPPPPRCLLVFNSHFVHIKTWIADLSIRLHCWIGFFSLLKNKNKRENQKKKWWILSPHSNATLKENIVLPDQNCWRKANQAESTSSDIKLFREKFPSIYKPDVELPNNMCRYLNHFTTVHVHDKGLMQDLKQKQ